MEGVFSLRIDGMQAVYEVETEQKAVVVSIGPHGDTYKKRAVPARYIERGLLKILAGGHIVTHWREARLPFPSVATGVIGR